MSQLPSTPSDQPAAAHSPAQGVRALAARLARLRAAVPETSPPAETVPPADPPPSAPTPSSAWERAAELRLSVIEKTLNNQNRLLLLTLVSVVADVALGATK